MSNAPRLEFGATVAHIGNCWFNLGRFGHPFGSMLVVFGTFADPF